MPGSNVDQSSFVIESVTMSLNFYDYFDFT